MTNPSENKLMILGIPTLLTMSVGLIVFLTLIYPPYRAMQARTWPEVPCVIIENSVREDTPEIRYRFDVNGRSQVGYRVHFGAVSDILPDSSYPLGLKTTCRANPRDPEDSVLVPVVGGSAMKIAGGVFGLVFFLPFTAACMVWSRFFRGRPLTVPRRPDEGA